MAGVLVTGGAGKLGTSLCLALKALGHEVRAFDVPQAFFGLLEQEGITLFKGDIRDLSLLEEAVSGVEAVFHLAALLPPLSEANPEATMEVNAGGTKKVLMAMQEKAPMAHLLFASSVATYGDTSAEEPPIDVSHPLRPMDIYGKSKVAAEQYIRGSGISHTIFRISGMAVPAFLDPPDKWPFILDQRIEFIALSDIVEAFMRAHERKEALVGEVFNIAGGPSWQVRGRDYLKRFYEIMDLPLGKARFPSKPGWLDWYRTQPSQRALGYQRTTLEDFFEQLQKAVKQAMEE